jgi:ubiquitin carboxyl-terminal hydrolase 36/42
VFLFLFLFYVYKLKVIDILTFSLLFNVFFSSFNEEKNIHCYVILTFLYILGELSNQGKFCSVCELTKLICKINPLSRNENAESNSISIASADSIRSHIHLISNVFTIGDQEDASEFLSFLFDHYITCLSSHLSMSFVPLSTLTIMDEIFAINLLSSNSCSSCLYTSRKQEVQNILFLGVKNLNNLTDAFAHFVKQETMKGENAMRCSNCDQLVKGNKRVTIHELSPILIITLKRFEITSFDQSEKLSHQVNYNELLDVSSYMTSHFDNCNKENQNINSSNDYLYQLYAVINHIGDDPRSGHYYSYIRSSNNRWFLVDDSRYRRASSNEVFNNSEAYILFYGKAFNISTNNNCSLQQQQSLTSLPTETDSVSYSSSILKASV